MGSLLEKYSGKIDLIYIDPPFAVGADFSFLAQIGDGDLGVNKDQSIIEEKAYRDTWGQGIDSYLQMMYERLTLIKELLSESGSLYLHCDWHVSHYLKGLTDEIFGQDRFQNELIWLRTTGHSDSLKWNHSHDVIFFGN